MIYRKLPQVTFETIDRRPVLINALGGRIAVDARLLKLWQAAPDRTLDELVTAFANRETSEKEVRAALACLVEAGLLERATPIPETPKEWTPLTGALVSAIIVDYNSQDWLAECLSSLDTQTYSPLEVIIVDNASTDESGEWIKAHYPDKTLLRLDSSHSFAHAVNYGIQSAHGEYLLVLNPDVRLEPDAIAQMVRVAQADSACGAVAAKLRFWWAPTFLNGLGNRVGALSWGLDNAVGHLDLGQFDTWRKVPSACFAAALIPRQAWDRVGALDEAFAMYYEDSEWSYRARLLGYTICVAPQAIVYHAFGGRVPSGNAAGLTPSKLRNVAYGRWRFVIKLLGLGYLLRFGFSYALEDGANVARAILRRDVKVVRAYVDAWRECLRSLPMLWRTRQALQLRRARVDRDIFALQAQMPAPLIWHGLPELTWDTVVDHYLPLMLEQRTRAMPEFNAMAKRTRLLLVSNDVVDAKMGGAGMRYLEMARVLCDDVDVTLAVPGNTLLEDAGFKFARYAEEQPATLQALVESHDVALISGGMIAKFPFLNTTRTRLVVDWYDPFFIENLFYYVNEPLAAQTTINRQAIDIVNALACVGDFFICGSERQRDFWLGILAANERINPQTFAQDASLRALIDVVGIGFPEREPRAHPVFRGVHPQFPPDARIVLWGGGLWDWLDPLTLVRAWPQVIAKHPEARLIFLGTRHPNPTVPTHRMAAQTQSLAEEIGEKDRTIFFVEWMAYAEREALLCEADIGVTLHPAHIETRYSVRTRVLDYFWARLPVLLSDGDVMSEWVRQFGVGRIVPPLDVDAVASALIEMLDQPKANWRTAFESIRDLFRWRQVVAPLRKYCLLGAVAPDRQKREQPRQAVQSSARVPFARALYIWRNQGARVLLHRIKRYIQWRMSLP